MVQLKYLHEKGCNLNSDCCTCAAAAAGQVEVLEFLQNVGCKRNIDTCCTAAKWGQVKVLKWLKGINRYRAKLGNVCSSRAWERFKQIP